MNLKASKNPFAIAVLACMYLIETKKSNSYTDRLLLKQELTAFIVDAVRTRAYDELTGLAIIDFVINILILPKKLEDTYLNHCYENYSKMEDKTSFSPRTIAFIDLFTQEYFQESYTNIIQQLKDAKKDRAAKIKAEQEAKDAKLKAAQEIKKAKLKVEQEAKKAKLKAEQEAKKAKLKNEKFIIKLHVEQKMDIPTIANFLEEKEVYIKTVLAKHK